MSKFADLKFTPAEVVKAVVTTVAACGFYAGITQKQEEISAKLDKVIAIQTGVDKLQDLRIQNIEADVSDIRNFNYASPAIKPKRLTIGREE